MLRRIATLPLATYQAGETVLVAGTKTGRADPQEGRGCNREGGHSDRQGGGIRRRIWRALSVAESAAHCRRASWNPQSFASRPSSCSKKIPSHSCMFRQSWHCVSTSLINVVELKSQIQLHHMIRSSIGKAVKKLEDLLSATGVYAPGI